MGHSKVTTTLGIYTHLFQDDHSDAMTALAALSSPASPNVVPIRRRVKQVETRKMTLIQTFFSDDYVIQVSDRRFTNRDGSVFDDEYTKLVCWNQTFTAGFTGIARMDAPLKKSTAEWIAEVLCDYPVFEYGVDAPRREAETTIRNLPTNWDNKRLAIVVAGFDQRSVPLCAEVANFDHLLAHHGYVIDQVQGTADSNNPDYQMMGIRYVKVPTVPNPS